jgi:hypothetical protein
MDFLILFVVTFRNPFMRLLVTFGNLSMTALAAFILSTNRIPAGEDEWLLVKSGKEANCCIEIQRKFIYCILKANWTK